MNPKEYKGKTVTHKPTQAIFTVTGGQKRGGFWFLKNAENQLYLFDECELIDIEFDVNCLRKCLSFDELSQARELLGKERFNQVWKRLEENPVELAAVSVCYCDDWVDFCNLTESCGVTKQQSPDLNQQFRRLLRVKGLEKQVKMLYATQQQEVS